MRKKKQILNGQKLVDPREKCVAQKYQFHEKSTT